MGIKLGLNAKLLHKVGGQGGGGSFTELTNARDGTLNLEASEADVTTRGSGGWRQVVTAIKDASVEWGMVWDPADSGLAAIKNAFLNRETIGLQIRDEASGEGLQADFAITGFSRSEPLEEALTVAVTAKVTYSETPPSWLTGS